MVFEAKINDTSRIKLKNLKDGAPNKDEINSAIKALNNYHIIVSGFQRDKPDSELVEIVYARHQSGKHGFEVQPKEGYFIKGIYIKEESEAGKTHLPDGSQLEVGCHEFKPNDKIEINYLSQSGIETKLNIFSENKVEPVSDLHLYLSEMAEH